MYSKFKLFFENDEYTDLLIDFENPENPIYEVKDSAIAKIENGKIIPARTEI